MDDRPYNVLFHCTGNSAGRRAIAAEFFGTMMLLVALVGSGIMVDVVKDGESGVLDNDLGAAALAALSLDREKVARYGRRFSWEHCTRQFLANLVPARSMEGRLVQTA